MKKIPIIIALLFVYAAAAYAADKDVQWIKYGLSQFKKGMYEKSVISFEQAIAANPENSYAYQCMGHAYLRLKDNEMAVEYFQRAYDIMPSPALKKQIEALDQKVFGEGKFMLYPLTFEAFVGMGFDTLSMTYEDFFGLKYGGMVTYHFINWFGVKAGAVMRNKAFDIPAVARFSYRLPFNSRTIMAFSFGGYAGFPPATVKGKDMGVCVIVDVHYVIGPVSLVGNEIIQYGLSDIKRLSFISCAGIAF